MLPVISSVILFFGIYASAFTGQTTETFTTSQQLDTSVTTAVWNIVANRIQPPMTMCDSINPPCLPNNEVFDVDIGTGSDGSFDVTTYANFGTISGGPTLTIDTDLHPYFNFTNFNLASGWTIQGVGSNPLWFKVQGTFTNSGTINCAGGNGGNVTALNVSTGGTGGVGVCGGTNGGTGGFTGTNGTNGGAGGTAITGGGGGTNSSAMSVLANGGGGGGSFGTGTNATGGTGGTAGGGAGTTFPDPYMGDFGTSGGPGSGSGGGGGGAYLFVDGHQGNGGGGGGGGGIIHIACGGDFIQNAGASMTANGGNGGNGVAGTDSGPGGGGAGGTVIIHGGGNMTDNGAVTALNGSAGTTGGGGTAGLGAIGRNWIANNIDGGANSFVGGGGENPGLALHGEVHFKSTTSYVAQSLSYDTLSTRPTYNFNLTTSLPNTSTAVLTIAESSDNFVSDNTGFLPASSLNSQTGKRFFKFNIQLQLAPGGAAAVTPATVTAFNAAYSPFQQSSFQFSPACGSFGSPGEFLFDIGLCFFFGFISNGRLRKYKPFRPSKNFPTS